MTNLRSGDSQSATGSPSLAARSILWSPRPEHFTRQEMKP